MENVYVVLPGPCFKGLFGGFGGAGQGVLSKDPTVWLDTNTCIPASWRMHLHSCLVYPHPKNMFANIKK